MIQAKFYNFSEKDLTNLYKEFSPNASKSTIQTFETPLKRIEKIYQKSIENLNLDFINNPDDIIKKFADTEYSKNTMYSTINMINKLIIMIDAPLALKKKWGDIVKKLTQERDNAQLDNAKTRNESENWIEYKELLDKVEKEIDTVFEMENIKSNDFRNLLIFCLYCLMPPARIGNYLDSKVIRDNADNLPSTHNYIIIKNMDNNPTFYFVFNKFKTAKSLGTQMFKVENIKLIALLHRYFKYHNKDGEYFLMSRGKELTQSNLTNILKKVSQDLTEKNLSCNMLRHIYITHFLSENPTLRQKLEIAGAMGQTYIPNQQDKYNRK
jgi:integrase